MNFERFLRTQFLQTTSMRLPLILINKYFTSAIQMRYVEKSNFALIK